MAKCYMDHKWFSTQNEVFCFVMAAFVSVMIGSSDPLNVWPWKSHGYYLHFVVVVVLLL